MKTKALKDFKTGEQFTLTGIYNENTLVYTFEKLTNDKELAVCKDQNGCGKYFGLEEEYYPIYFSSLDGMPYRD